MNGLQGGGSGSVTYDPSTGLWYNRGVLITPTFSVAALADLYALDPATYNGSVLNCTGVGLGGSLWKASSALDRWVLAGPCFLADYYLDADNVALASDKSVEQLMRALTIPVATDWNAASRSLFQAGDILRIFEEFQYAGAGAATTYTIRHRMFTAAGTSGTNIRGGSVAIDNVSFPAKYELRRRAATTVRMQGIDSADPFPGNSSTALSADVTVANLDAATMYLNLTGNLNANDAGQNVTLKTYTVELITPGH